MHANEKNIYFLIKKKTQTNVRFWLMQTNSCYYYYGYCINKLYCKVGPRLWGNLTKCHYALILKEISNPKEICKPKFLHRVFSNKIYRGFFKQKGYLFRTSSKTKQDQVTIFGKINTCDLWFLLNLLHLHI